ncbi:hypothetical protein [Kaistella sp.]|uniref:hypothetical protein n=1 Tax=Kaistella sp. TaxID=2782235 RepID=UPI003C446536
MLSGAVSSLIASGVQALGNTGSRMFVNNDGYLDIGTFAERNPGLLKAMMVTSGGLSGGISSTIAGGKFIDGFKQGLITSGLNHVAHLTTEFLQRNDPADPTTWTRKYSIDRIKRLHPDFYEVLAQLPNFLNSNPKVLDALVETTKMTKTQILKHLDVNSSDGQVILEYDYYATKTLQDHLGDTGHMSVTTI